MALKGQSALWTAGYIVVGLLVAVCAMTLPRMKLADRRRTGRGEFAAEPPGGSRTGSRSRWSHRG